MLVLGLQLPSHSSNYEFWGTEYPSCLFSFTPRCNTLTSFPPPPALVPLCPKTKHDTNTCSAWILLYQTVRCIHLPWRWKSMFHPKTGWRRKMLCSVEHLLAGGKWYAFSVPKTTWGWTFDFNPCQDCRTWNFFVFSPCKTIPFYCEDCVKVATKAQPSVMAHIIPDLAWHHQSSCWTANFSPCFHQFDAFFSKHIHMSQLWRHAFPSCLFLLHCHYFIYVYKDS